MRQALMLDVRPPAWGAETIQVPSELAGVTSLGAPLKVHAPAENRYQGALIAGAMGAVLTAMGLGFAVGVQPIAGAPVGTMGLLLLGIALYNVMRLRAAASQLVTYEGGIAAAVRGVASVYPWPEIVSVTTKEKRVRGKRIYYNVHRYDIAKASGETLILLNECFPDAQSIARTIRERSTAKQLPQLQASYDSGMPVTFGAVTASKSSITMNGQTIPWSQVANAVVNDGRLTVTTKAGAKHRTSVWEIPNIELLGALIGIPPHEMDLVYF